MILLDEEGQQTKLDAFVAGPTLRLPDRASIASARTVTPLPDYETSQAQHIISPIKSSTRRIDSKFWRATLYALAIYVGLSVVIGVPLIVTVSIQLRFFRFPIMLNMDAETPGPQISWSTAIMG